MKKSKAPIEDYASEVDALRKANKILRSTLKQREKALNEANALLDLKKKVDRLAEESKDNSIVLLQESNY